MGFSSFIREASSFFFFSEEVTSHTNSYPYWNGDAGNIISVSNLAQVLNTNLGLCNQIQVILPRKKKEFYLPR